MGYVILSNGDINGNDVKNHHIFNAKIKDVHRLDNTIEIEITSENPICSNSNLSPKIKKFGLKRFQIKVNSKIPSISNNEEYGFYYYVVCKPKRKMAILDTDYNYYNIYYVNNEKELMILAANIGKDICGNCISTLYSDDDK